MIYLELKDGDKIFTDANSDDKKEFEKILNDKLGRDAAELFDNLMREHDENVQQILSSVARRYKDCINRLDQILNTTPLNTIKLEEILSDLQKIYTDYLV